MKDGMDMLCRLLSINMLLYRCHIDNAYNIIYSMESIVIKKVLRPFVFLF